MADRILTWHFEGVRDSNARMGAAYFMEADYEPVGVRAHAETAPSYADAEFNIFKDGVSILKNRAPTSTDIYGRITVPTARQTVVITKGNSSEDVAEDFLDAYLEQGTWITCKYVAAGGGSNFTVQLELKRVSNEDTPIA